MKTLHRYWVALCVAGSMALSSQAAITDITSGTLTLNGHQYRIFSAPVISWDNAAGYIQANLTGWHLATSTDAIENAFIWSGITAAWAGQGNTTPARQYWLGGYQRPAQTWNWVTGEAWSYSNWASGEPNGDANWNGHLSMGRYSDERWNDEGAWPDGIDGFVAEFSVVPEPSTCIAGALLLLPFGLRGVRYLRNRKA